MKLQLRYNTISIIYFILCMFALVLFLCIDMQGQEHSSEGIKGARTMLCLLAMVISASVLILYFIPNYNAYRPTATMTLYLLYMIWVFIPIINNEIKGDYMESVMVLVKHLIPFFSLLLPFNYLQNHGDSKLFGWFFCFSSCAFAISYIRVYVEYISMYFELPPMIISYYTLYILPLIMLVCGNKRKIFFVIFTCIILISSIKRGGIVAMGCGLISYGFVSALISKKFNMKHIITSLVVIGLLTTIFIFMADTDDNNLMERFAGMEDDGGSDRTIVWSVVANMINNSDFFSLVFGHGYNAVAQDASVGVSAHNDFLEITYDYGLMGGVLYLFAFLSLIGDVFLYIKNKTSYAPALAMFTTIYLCLSMMSHVAIYSWFNIILLTIGYVSGKVRLDERNK